MGTLLEKVTEIAESIGLADVDDSEVDTDQLVDDVMGEDVQRIQTETELHCINTIY